MTPWALVLFIVAGAVLVRLGVALAALGDELAERTGLGRLFVGTIFVALATSLPELGTDITAVLVDAPDLAVGDLFGSSAANMAILAIVDLRARGRVWPGVDLGHARVAAVAIVLTAVAAIGVLTPGTPALGWIGVDTMLIAGLYIGAVAWFRRTPVVQRMGVDIARVVSPVDGAPRSTAALVGRFAACAAGILVAAPAVTIAVQRIADDTGLGETFVGVGLLAVTTSLPELVVAIAAVRLGAHDLAVGNLFGSNAVNMAMLLVLDVVYLDGPILAAVASGQAVAALGAILLMSLAVAAIVGGTETRVARLEPDAVAVLLAYAIVLGAVAAAT